MRALSIRTPTLRVDKIRHGHGRTDFEQQGMRGRFALRFQSEESDTGRTTRPEQVRGPLTHPSGLSFSRPPRSVRKASTSTSTATWSHWNLPSDPVDLEQREGRVHRYKGHAVRKNVAHEFRDTALRGTEDPWDPRPKPPGQMASARSSRSGFSHRLAVPGSSATCPDPPLSRAQLPPGSTQALTRAIPDGLRSATAGGPVEIPAQAPSGWGPVEALMQQARIDLSPPRSREPDDRPLGSRRIQLASQDAAEPQ